MCDVREVAQCLPGAEITRELGDDRYEGLFSVKLGPLAAAFKGELQISRDDAAREAVVSGKGADSRSGSRASGRMTYRVKEAAGGASTEVQVVSEIDLAGALAQFGKAAVMQEVANRITAEFVRNFELRLAQKQAGPAGPAPAEEGSPSAPHAQAQGPGSSSSGSLNIGALAWSMLRDSIGALIKKIFQRG